MDFAHAIKKIKIMNINNKHNSNKNNTIKMCTFIEKYLNSILKVLLKLKSN